jgi:hypothetical protein
MEGNMRIEVDLKFRCKGCGLPVEVEMEYNPTMEEMPPIPRNYLQIPVCNNCVDLRIHRISKLLKEGVDGE